MFKTYYPKQDEINKKWYVVDAENVVLGRLASQIATILRGKHKPTFTPHMDTGDFVIVVNAEKVRLSGKKSEMKQYFSHSGYIGHEKFTSFKEVLAKHPDRILKNAVRGMLPHNKLGKKIFNNLKIYAGPDHPHQAQAPETLKVEG